ncbi:MAG: glycosyltransferase family A protein [Pirellulales bacterium]
MDQLSQYTVLIPAYNARTTIEETLDSIQKQDIIGSVRIIVADDASTDDTVDIATKFFEKNNTNSQVWRSEKNGGERKTVNLAFERLRSEGVRWCFVLHADDVSKMDWLSTLAFEMNAADQKTVSICSSWDDWYADRIDPGEDRPAPQR